MDGQNIIEVTLHGVMTGNVDVLAMKRLVKNCEVMFISCKIEPSCSLFVI